MSEIEASILRNAAKKSVNLIIRSIFHTICFILYVVVFLFGLNMWYMITEEQMQEPLLNNFKAFGPFFLTNWNYYFQTLFLGLSVFHDILECLDKQESTLASRIKYWRDVIFCSIVVPFTLFITSMFWCVYAIDRELVFPKVYDEVVPWWFNHCVHTNITIMIVIETIIQTRRKPTNKKLELILYWSGAFAYTIVNYSIYFVTNKWVYQIFGVMTWWQVCLYQLMMWGGSYVFYEMQFPINRLLHKEENDVRKDKENDTKVETEEDNFSKS